MSNPNRILITGAAGKVGQAFINRLLQDQTYDRFILRALCHHRQLEGNERLEIVRGSIEQRSTVESALDGVSHVVHLATCTHVSYSVVV
jgi:UDP-glucose 4-epimerase